MQTNSQTYAGSPSALAHTGHYSPAKRRLWAMAATLGLGLSAAQGGTLINLDATTQAVGPLFQWANTGTVAGDFYSQGEMPEVITVDGVKGIAFKGGTSGWEGTSYTGPTAPESICGSASRTIEAWVWDPSAQGEKTVFAWGHRGGNPDGSNCTFGHGNHPGWGCFGGWGFADMGYSNTVVFAKWTYIAYTYDSATRTAKTYQDGVLSSLETYTTQSLATWTNDSNGSAIPFRVARQTEANGLASDAGVGTNVIAKIRLQDVAMTEAQVQSQFNAEKKAFGLVDSDGDGMPDWYETRYGLNKTVNDANLDLDNDGLTNLAEYQKGTLPNNPDTDNDGLKDGVETGTGVWVSATNTGTDPFNPDTDGDGLKDGVESNTGVFVSASNTGTNPFKKDTDGDSWEDASEVLFGSNPNQANSTPSAASWAAAIGVSKPKYWYRFEETDPTQAAQNSGSATGFQGAYGPGIVSANLGKASALPSLGKAIEFTGPAANNQTTKYVDMAATVPVELQGNPNIPELVNLRSAPVDKTTTVEYWIKTTQKGTHGNNSWQSPSILAHESPGDGDMYWGKINNTGEFGFSTSDINDVLTQRDMKKNVTDGEWHHLVMVKEWHTNKVCVSTMYIDGGSLQGGASFTTTTAAGNPSYQDNDSLIRYLGLTQSGELDNVQYIGLLDEVAIYDRALTADEVRVHSKAVLEADTDGDGMPDVYELNNGLNPNVNDANADADNDGATNLTEYRNHTNPQNPDTDGDGLKDGVETGTGVWVSATNTGTDPLNADTDGDGLKDGVESNTGVFVSASNTGTNPFKKDTDNDSWGDASEVLFGSNPNQASSTPSAANWATAVGISQPKYWYRFEETESWQVATNSGSAIEFQGMYGPGIVSANLGKASALPSLGKAIEFTGPAADQYTPKYVDMAAMVPMDLQANPNIPELVNLRSAPVDKTTTVEYWFKTTQKGTHGNNSWQSPSILAHESPGDGDMYWGKINDQGEFGFSTSDINDVLTRRDMKKNVTDGEWHHLVMIKEWHISQPSVSTMYIDGGPLQGGASFTATTAAGNPSYQDNDSLIRYLGLTQSGELENVQYIGMLDEVAIYDRALTADEVRFHSKAVLEADTDGDGMPDVWELNNGLNPNVNDAAADPDQDGVPNLAEYRNHTNPHNPDTDGDGLKDGVETGTGVWVSATNTGTDPLNADTDGDGLKDGVESNTGVFVNASNTGTSPLVADSDGDWFRDGEELLLGTNPLDKNSQPVPASWTAAVQADQPVHWLRFEEATTASGAANLGSAAPQFTVTYGSGIANADLGKASAYPSLGKALEFTGPEAANTTTKYVDFGQAIPELINLRQDSTGADIEMVEGKTATLEFWFKTTLHGSNGNDTWRNPAILAHESGGDGDMYWGNFNQAGDFIFSTSDMHDAHITNGYATDGKWHHVVMTKIWHNTESCVSRLYMDGGAFFGGKTIETTTTAGRPSGQDNDSDIRYLGFTQNGEFGNVQYIGLIDEVAIYTKAFTEAQARLHYIAAGGQPPAPPTVTLQYQKSGSNIILTWPQGTLVSADEVDGTYTPVTGATSPYTVDPASSRKFYRVLVK